MNTRIFAFAAAFMMCAVCFAVVTSDDSDAATYGSQSDPLTSVSGTAKEYYNSTIYAAVGSSVSIRQIMVPNEDYMCESVTSGYGLSTSNGNLTGTLSKAGTVSVPMLIVDTNTGMECETGKTTIVSVAKAAPSYTVSFNSNGGSSSPSARTAESGSSISLPSPGSRTNYTFNGWYTASSGGSYVGGSGSSYTVNGNTTLYAQWSYVAPSTYYYAYLYFNADGGSGAPSTLSSSMYGTSASGSASFTVPSAVPTRGGYTFLGWSQNSGASSASYQSGSGISVPYGASKTLYAVWSHNDVSITTSHGASAIVVGDSFSYAVGTNVAGCTLTVSGASWLSVSGSTVIGTPSSSDTGTFNVTVTASKAGYTSDTQTFTVTVSERLSFTSAPTGSILIEAA